MKGWRVLLVAGVFKDSPALSCHIDNIGESMPDEEIVKVKKSDLETLINANVKAYNLLDEIKASTAEVEEKVREAYSELEAAPSEMSDIIVEEEEEGVTGGE